MTAIRARNDDKGYTAAVAIRVTAGIKRHRPAAVLSIEPSASEGGAKPPSDAEGIMSFISTDKAQTCPFSNPVNCSNRVAAMRVLGQSMLRVLSVSLSVGLSV